MCDDSTPSPYLQFKTCARCHKSKPVTDFFAAPRDKNKRRPHCKHCHNKDRSPASRWAIVADSLRLRYGSTPGVPMLRKHLGDPEECYLCGDPLTWGEASVDHVIPLSRGGTNDLDNLQWTHRHCNQAKGAFTLDELVEFAMKLLHQHFHNGKKVTG